MEIFGLGTLAIMTAAQFATTQYYPQYPAFLAPFLAIVLGMALGRFASWHGRRIAWGVAVTGICVLALTQVRMVEGRSTMDVQRAVDSVVPAGACALADRPEFLVTSDRFVSSIAGCTQMVDPFGSFLAFAHDPSGGVATFRTAIVHADYLVLGIDINRWFGGSYAVLRGYVSDHFHIVAVAPLHIYVRDGFSPS